MGVAFSDSEIETIRTKLKLRARECMLRYGVRKTSVKDIVSAAGISTGAFYKFYDSKELLFFEVIEEMHTEIFTVAEEILNKHSDLVIRERVILALLSCCRKTAELGFMQVWEAEAAYLLRKLPEEALRNHNKNEGTRIVKILTELGIHASLPTVDVADILQCLLSALAQPMSIGAERSQRVTEFMIRAICEKLFPD
jgi:AcrR family transcriptional regulator